MSFAEDWRLKGLIGVPGSGVSDGSEVTSRFGRNNDLIVAQDQGKYSEPSSRGRVFSANVAAVTVPVVANNLVSVFALYNPPGSGVLMELIDFDATNVVAATVVDGIGLYYSPAALSAAATFTTPGTVISQILDNGPQNNGRFYSALTHSGTPILAALMGGDPATTAQAGIHHSFDGKVQIPPGIVASVAMTTAASTANGITLGLSWLERPI